MIGDASPGLVDNLVLGEEAVLLRVALLGRRNNETRNDLVSHVSSEALQAAILALLEAKRRHVDGASVSHQYRFLSRPRSDVS